MIEILYERLLLLTMFIYNMFLYRYIELLYIYCKVSQKCSNKLYNTKITDQERIIYDKEKTNQKIG